MKYAEIVNDIVISTYDILPSTYNNISNFFALDTQSLNDLDWSGNIGVKFYEYIPDPIPENTNIVSTSYTIDHESKKVYGSYITEPIAPPQTITATQVRLWLIDNNINLDDIVIAINSIQDPLLKQKTLIQWEYAPYIERNHPLIETIGSMLGLNSEQIDNAFLQASLIN